ncbi:unnamed protein product [Closterium sp. Naga37s-1]|nr:unnamed protein product [Closterium sp. Naga37s-1]
MRVSVFPSPFMCFPASVPAHGSPSPHSPPSFPPPLLPPLPPPSPRSSLSHPLRARLPRSPQVYLQLAVALREASRHLQVPSVLRPQAALQARLCSAPKRRFKPYTAPVSRNANDLAVRKERKAQLQGGGGGGGLDWAGSNADDLAVRKERKAQLQGGGGGGCGGIAEVAGIQRGKAFQSVLPFWPAISPLGPSQHPLHSLSPLSLSQTPLPNPSPFFPPPPFCNFFLVSLPNLPFPSLRPSSSPSYSPSPSPLLHTALALIPASPLPASQLPASLPVLLFLSPLPLTLTPSPSTFPPTFLPAPLPMPLVPRPSPLIASSLCLVPPSLLLSVFLRILKNTLQHHGLRYPRFVTVT